MPICNKEEIFCTGKWEPYAKYTHTHIYIYIYMCLCVYKFNGNKCENYG